MITCEKFLDRIDDYVDDALPAAMREECETHAAACEACRAELTAQRRLLELAKTLPNSIEPERDLWTSVRRQLGIRRDSTRSARMWPSGAALKFAQVAAAAAVVFGAVFWAGFGRDPETGPGTQQSVSAVEQEYRQAKEELLAELYAAESNLPPNTIAAVEENLRIIEDAVIEIRVALNENPNNPHLERILAATYKNQIDLLQQAVFLAHGS